VCSRPQGRARSRGDVLAARILQQLRCTSMLPNGACAAAVAGRSERDLVRPGLARGMFSCSCVLVEGQAGRRLLVFHTEMKVEQ
jgi:hypothetical protein